MVARIESVACAAARGLAIAGFTLLLALAVCTVMDGLLRWLFRSPLDIVRDIGGLTAAVSISCCLPLALLKHSHISIQFLDARVSLRARNCLATFSTAVMTCICALIAWQFVVYAGKVARAGDVTIMMRVQMAPFWVVVALMMAFSAACQFILLSLAIQHLVRNVDDHPSHERRADD